jgi:hypothetical protein
MSQDSSKIEMVKNRLEKLNDKKGKTKKKTNDNPSLLLPSQ